MLDRPGRAPFALGQENALPASIPELTFGRQLCTDLARSAAREWLVTDGLGGFAMGTIAGLRTRRYHGLLVVAGDQPGRRHVGLAALDVVVVRGDRRVRLSTHEWGGGAIEPAGHMHLSSFDLADGVPRWRWSGEGVIVEREIAMGHGRSLVAIRHTVVAGPDEIGIEVTPLCTWRDAHGDRFAGADPEVEACDGGFEFEAAYRVSGPNWLPGGAWYRDAWRREEAERGLGPAEDLWAAGKFGASLRPGESLDVVAAASGDSLLLLPSGESVVAESRARAQALLARAGVSASTDARLVAATDQFIVTTATGPAVVAGYPWFGEWSRDTMTSYEGLFVETGRTDEGRALLLRYASGISEGMLPNTGDSGSLEYNTADATLWFVHAIGRHVQRTNDLDLVVELGVVLDQLIEHHIAGARFNIRVDPADGLLVQGAEGVALTWMDALVGGRAVTLRAGKAVEINALWINALGTIGDLHGRTGRLYRWAALEARARQSFAARFVRPDGLGLYDVVDGPSGADASIRPNQLFALSLPFGPGGPASIVTTCRDHLLTSLGLRTLSSDDPSYRGRHRGDVLARDEAYHQGTTWPWLIGAYVDACIAVRAPTVGLLDGLTAHLGEWGLGSVSETADGDAPHDATGCPFQAWSVAELLRARRRVDRTR